MPPGFFQVRWGGAGAAAVAQLGLHVCARVCVCVCARVCVCSWEQAGDPYAAASKCGGDAPCLPPPPTPNSVSPEGTAGLTAIAARSAPPPRPHRPHDGAAPPGKAGCPPSPPPPPTSPSSHRSYPLLQPFMSPRYPGGPRPALRMNQVRFPPAVRPRWGTELLQGSRCALTPPPPNRSPAATRGCPRLSAAAAQRHGPGCAGTG